jgi:hypothetical protein
MELLPTQRWNFAGTDRLVSGNHSVTLPMNAPGPVETDSSVPLFTAGKPRRAAKILGMVLLSVATLLVMTWTGFLVWAVYRVF